MNVLTVSRQLGSEGDWIARQIARELDWSYLDHAIMNRAAREAGVPEVALAHIDEMDFLGIKPSPQSRRAYINKVEEILHELADQGNVVIAGCAAQIVLRNQPDAGHVQVIAPLELRLARVMAGQRIAEDAALNRLFASDKRRALYLKDNYAVNWDDPSLYDLVINTQRISREDAVPIIIHLVQCVTCRPHPTSKVSARKHGTERTEAE